MKVIKNFESFNHRRFGNPWVAIVVAPSQIDFQKHIGGYTGAYGKGEAGQLYINNPQEGTIYAYGQKDYRGNSGFMEYLLFCEDQFIPIEKDKLVDAFLMRENEMCYNQSEELDSNEMEER